MSHVHLYSDTQPRLSAAERAYHILRGQIISLELAPNESIGEQMLAQSLGVSRTPVREALSRLSHEGLVDVRSRSGGVVAPIRMEAVRSAQFVREALESAVIDACIEQQNPQVMFNLRQTIDTQKFAIAQNDLTLFFNADEHMHSLLCQFADQSSVWKVIVHAKHHLDRVRRISLSEIDLGTLLDDHQQLIGCIEHKDKSGAGEVVRRHLRRVLNDLEVIHQRHPDYFDQAINPDKPRSSTFNQLTGQGN